MEVFVKASLLLSFFFQAVLAFDPEDANLSAPQLIEKLKYPVETHKVTTSDGYILQLHRIPQGKKAKPNGRALLLIHGLLGSTDGLVLNGENSIGIVLADAGYDVWMPNTRGNIYSRTNKKLSPSTSEFWDFDWNELATIDLPAIIDYISTKTGIEKIDIVGHSDGGTMPLILLSKKPKFSKKIRTLISIAPPAFTFTSTSLLFKTVCLPKVTLPITNYYDGAPPSDITTFYAKTFCSITDTPCQSFYWTMFGPSSDQIEKGFFDVLAGHYFSGSSVKVIIHQCQHFFVDAFQEYDYGSKNPTVYGTATPPPYNLEKVPIKVFIYHSDKDSIATIEGIDNLASKLPKSEKRFVSDFNHLDWIFGTRAASSVYSDIIKVLNKN